MSKKLLFLFTAALIFSCNNTKKMQAENNIPFKKDKFDQQGHRGCRGLMPENTIPAMLHTLGYNVSTLEMDVVITKDKKPVLSHEPFFNHEITTRPDGTFIEEKEEKAYNIYRMDYEEVKTYDIGMKPHPRFTSQQKIKLHKPLLSEVFAAVKQDMMTRRRPFPFFNIETKSKPATDDLYHPRPAEFVELIMQVIKENEMEDFCIIQSFDFRTLQYLHQHYPQMKTAMLIEAYDPRSFEKQLDDLGFTPSIYSPAYQLVNEKLVEACHKRNIKLIPWTVNDKAGIEKIKALGADGVISDYPNLFE